MKKTKMVKVAVVTDDNKTISPHFGRAQYYLVYEIQEGVIVNRETRPKSSHHHNEMVQLRHPEAEEETEPNRQHHHDAVTEVSLHDEMLSSVRDCEALIARGMGAGMYAAIRQLGISPYVTNAATADDAIQAYIKGTLDNHTERLH